MLRAFLADDHAATAIEYAVIAGIVSIGIIASLMAFQSALDDLFAFVSVKVTSNI